MDTQTPGQDTNSVHTEMKIPTAFSEKNHSQTGVILGILIVALAIIFGGLYLWGASLSNTTTTVVPTAEPVENREPETPRALADTQALEVVSSSDELDAIEADIESTNLNTLGSELDEIGRELGVTQ